MRKFPLIHSTDYSLPLFDEGGGKVNVCNVSNILLNNEIGGGMAAL